MKPGDVEIIQSSGNVFDDLDLKCCGNCELHTDEDSSGFGWCQFNDGQTRCDNSCRHWTPRVAL